MNQFDKQDFSRRQKNSIVKLRKTAIRIQRKMDIGSFRKLTNSKQKRLLMRLKRYALQLKRWGISLRIGASTSALAIALALGTPVSAQTFTEKVGLDNPLDGVDVGLQSAASFVDIDDDGDMDVFIGNSGESIFFYQNTGSATNPIFTEQTGSTNPFDGLVLDSYSHSRPTFVDIDNDGDMDAFIGEHDDGIMYFENTGTPIIPTFTERTGQNNPLDGVGDSGFYVNFHPIFADIDDDGDFDAFIGEGGASVLYYKNTGTNTNPVFTQQSGVDNPLDLVVIVTDFDATPGVIDLDQDGDLDVFVGMYNGNIDYYENTGSANSPYFVDMYTTNPLYGLTFSKETVPSFVDIDDDGDMDLFVGFYEGQLRYLENNTIILSAELSSFEAEIQGAETLLTWQTANEENNRGFEIQRAVNEELDRNEWTSLGFVEGNNNSNTPQNYSFKDKEPLVGTNYYRLNLVDQDGSFEHSNIINVAFDIESQYNISVAPNPVRGDAFTVSISTKVENAGTISIYDTANRLMHTQAFSSTKTTISTEHLPRGIYFVSIDLEERMVWRRIVVQ